jgi:eukaryotic-like serine/threonine-protein kinase
MKAERWQQINDLFQSATECPSEERATFLDEACHGDKSLRREVESLLASYERAENFIESPAYEGAPELLTNDDRAGALVGESIGHYRIESLIGVGGMGEVYLARDDLLGRKVALKFLPERLTADVTQLSRFKTEARAASALNHPNILTVYEIGAVGNRHFIATEFIEGITLRASLAGGKMNLHDALNIAVQAASALAAAHETGVVHRDIKPENIMLRPDGYVKVLDFGIAKLTEQQPASDSHGVGTTTALQTRPDLVLGTARYMSPEQARGQIVDGRTDIWSLGTVLYEMTAGVAPFAGETPSDCIASILTTEPPLLRDVLSASRTDSSCGEPDVPLKLQAIVQKALRKNRDERYQTIKEMLADLRHLKEESEAKGSSPQAQARDEPLVTKIKRHKRAASLTLAGAMLAVGALAYHFYFVAPAQSPTEKSIAVLPFADLSQARDQEYFCDGIQEEILTRLAKIADLKVISRTSTQRFKSAPKNLPQIAKQLGVANILEGTVQKADNQVRVHVQLISARNDSHLWAEKYDRKLTDVFGVESEIAKAIANTLQARLSGSEQRAIATRPTENAEAHQLYLKGTFFFNKRTGPDLRTSIEYFKNAIGQDPNYALAYAGLADAYALLSLYGGEGSQETVSQAKAAARKALELEDTLPEAHNSLGLVLALFDFDFAQSKKEFERAIELNPNYATAHHQFGNMNLAMSGEFDRAIAEGKRAVELDPLSLIINADFGQNFLLARRYDEAIDQFRKTLAMDARFYYARWSLGEALQMRGQLDEAMAEYQKAAEVADDPIVLALLAQGYARTGQGDKAWNLLSQLEQLATERHVGPLIFAVVHLALGENEKAIDDLERAYRERADPYIVGIKVEPLLDPLRGDPRFERLVAKVAGTAENNSPAQMIETKSIAVLPFENLSSEPDNAYFADGIQEEILTRLAKIADLKVISRTSTQRFKSAPKNLLEIAKQLGVAHILEGTVQKMSDQVRVNVQLINAQNDSHLWADKYDRKLTDIFAVESEIAGKIADSLKVKLSGAEQKALQAYPTESSEAHQLYLRGRYVMEKRTPADLNRAAEYFNQAIALDPNYAAAYAGLADCYVLLPQWKLGPVAEYLSKARAAANKALQIDSNLADAHASLGMVAFGEKLDLREAKREFERAIQLNPNYALAHYCLAYSVLLALGNHDQAIKELKRAIELDPVSSVINTNLGYAYILARLYPEAIGQLRKTIELNPDFAYAHAILGEALELSGQLDDAFMEYEKSYNAGHDFRGLMMMARVHGLKGDRAKALQLFEQAKQLNSPDIWAFGCAMVYLGLGDRNEALNWLEQSYQQKEFINVSTIKHDPLFDPLHGDPRFEKLAKQIVPPDVISGENEVDR